MPPFQDIFNDISGTQNYGESARLLHYLGNVFTNSSNKIKLNDAIAAKAFAINELKRLLTVIPQVSNYKQKDEIFGYEDALLHVYTAATKIKGAEVANEEADIIKQVVQKVANETKLESSVEQLMKSEKIEKSQVEAILNNLKTVKDEYQRGKLFSLLLEGKTGFEKFSQEAKQTLAEYTDCELNRIIKLNGKDGDATAAMEFAVDVCKYYADEKLLKTVLNILQIPVSSVRYYAVETLLKFKKDLPADIIDELAQDLSYAELTYGTFLKYGKEELFPQKFATEEYLAKSDLVHWLIYPTELGKAPYAIELLGDITVKKEKFYIFKYKSDSQNLTDDLKDEWLIGWSSNEGGTFSNFDLLSVFEKKTLKKTLKNIAKKLLK